MGVSDMILCLISGRLAYQDSTLFLLAQFLGLAMWVKDLLVRLRESIYQEFVSRPIGDSLR
jgi:hypothetical protein